MARLPNPGSDDGQWGTILNDFLAQAHDSAGVLKADSVGTTQIQDGAVTTTKLSAASPSTGQVLSYNGVNLGWATPSGSGSVPDADGATKGLVQLAGDLGGTAASPSVAKIKGVTLPASAPSTGQVLTATGATTTSWSSPASVPVTSVAGKTGAVTLAESDIANLTTDLSAKAADSGVVHNTGVETLAGVKTFSSSPVVPTPTSSTQAANKSYVDSTVSAGAPDASTSTKGIIQLTGDLGGSATNPSVLKVNGIAVSGTPTNGQVLTASSGTAASWSTPSGGSSLTVKDEGTNLTTAATSLNFVGSGVTATNSGAAVTVTVNGASGGARSVTGIKTSAYTPSAGEYVIVNPTSSGFTVTLPTGQTSGTSISLKNIGTNSNAVLIVPGGTDHIEDSGNYDGVSVSLNSGQTDMDFVYDGTSRWYRIG